ncbi:MAG: VOC family protein [Spirochaetota bacterium]
MTINNQIKTTRNMYVLAVPDLQASANYYEEKLGFSIHEIGDDGWRMYKLDTCCIMAGHCPDALPVKDLGDHSYFAYIVLNDIDAYYEKLRAAQVELIKEIATEPWQMREFGIRTLDGHRIMFGMDV